METGKTDTSSDARLIIQPGVFAGLVGIFTLGVAFSFGAKIVLGVTSLVTWLSGLAALACVGAAWFLFGSAGRTALGQRAVIALAFLGTALVNTDILLATDTAPVYRASVAMWWAVTAAFALEWWRYRKRQRAGR